MLIVVEYLPISAVEVFATIAAYPTDETSWLVMLLVNSLASPVNLMRFISNNLNWFSYSDPFFEHFKHVGVAVGISLIPVVACPDGAIARTAGVQR